MEFDWHSGGIYGRHAGCATRVCFYEALKKDGKRIKQHYLSLMHFASIKLTLITAAIILPINTIIGVALAYLITRHQFRGKFVITTLLDLPFAVSPVVAGPMFVLVFGANTRLGGYLESMGIQVILRQRGLYLQLYLSPLHLSHES